MMLRLAIMILSLTVMVITGALAETGTLKQKLTKDYEKTFKIPCIKYAF